MAAVAGGGGGWEGGGGGSGGERQGVDSGGGGGGGGLSFADPLATDVVFGTSQLPGDGVVVIHWESAGLSLFLSRRRRCSS